MTAEAERRRVADALRPKGGRRPAAPPPPDPDDDMLDAPDAQAGTDAVAVWRMDPVTQLQQKKFRQEYSNLIARLVAAGTQSTDPRVAVLAGQATAVRAAAQALGGKP